MNAASPDPLAFRKATERQRTVRRFLPSLIRFCVTRPQSNDEHRKLNAQTRSRQDGNYSKNIMTMISRPGPLRPGAFVIILSQFHSARCSEWRQDDGGRLQAISCRAPRVTGLVHPRTGAEIQATFPWGVPRADARRCENRRGL